jgi:hypothetical protein
LTINNNQEIRKIKCTERRNDNSDEEWTENKSKNAKKQRVQPAVAAHDRTEFHSVYRRFKPTTPANTGGKS